MGSTAALRALSALFPHGDCAGKALGIAQSDELSGALTLAFSLLTVNGTGLEGQFDSRVPICELPHRRRGIFFQVWLFRLRRDGRSPPHPR